MRDVSVRISLVLVNVERIGCVHSDLLKVGDQRRNRILAGKSSDARELGFQRLQAKILEPCLVHEASVEIADLLLFRVRRGALQCDRLYELAQLRLNAFGELVVGPPLRFVGRNRRCSEPLTIDVGEEVVLRPHRRVELPDVDA